MNLSIFLKLCQGVKEGKIKLNSDYKHYDYMIDKGWVIPIIDDYKSDEVEDLVFIMPVYADYVEITPSGIEYFYNIRNRYLKRLLYFSITVIVIPLIKYFFL
ncbi:hypothetical protein NQ043_09690 [Staphylococcus hyicus]|uniref:hypothetical protein n=1 Tax=Staphylococcus hyicus TaxID=1284 RepID=UPI00211C9C62|nr:hypothetical protein [Staphylococcus hyicus]MCQ9301398.1 hypothetical protein [Staphylococcus hyicus]